MKRKFVLGIVAIICVAVCLLTSSLFHISEEDEALYSAYRKQSYHNNLATSMSIIEMVEKENIKGEESEESSVTNIPGSGVSVLPGITDAYSWLDVLDSVHKAWGQAGATYEYGGKHSMTLWGEVVTCILKGM